MKKRKAMLAVLFAAAMSMTVMCGTTVFANSETDAGDASAPEAPVNENVDPNNGDNVGPNAGDNIGPNAGDNVGPNAGDNIGPNNGDNVDQNAGDNVDQNANGNVDQNTGESVDQNTNENVDQNTGENVDQNTGENVDQNTGESVDQNATNTEPTETQEAAEQETYVIFNDTVVSDSESDEYISVGEGQGSYKYNEGTLVLNNVVLEFDEWLPGISVNGPLIITLEGENSIITYQGAEGIRVFNGDLTINGDGSLYISTKGGGYAAFDEEGFPTNYYEGIYVADGDLTIDGAKVDIEVFSNDMYPNSGIGVLDGDVNIINGAVVNVESTPMEDGMTHYGIRAANGKINIIDSNVTASAKGDFRFGEEETMQAGFGLYSGINSIPFWTDSYWGTEATTPTGILIKNSNVNASGSVAAMMTWGLNSTIDIQDSTIVSPDGANVRNFIGTATYYPEDWENIDDVQVLENQLLGAVLAFGEGDIDYDAIIAKLDELYAADDTDGAIAYLNSLLDQTVKDTTIIRNSELVNKASFFPSTGDENGMMSAAGSLLAMLTAVCIAIAVIRKRYHA